MNQKTLSVSVSFSLILGTFALMLTSACSKEGNAKIQLSNTTTSALLTQQTAAADGASSRAATLTAVTPTTFQMKFLTAYLVEDVDSSTSNNVGEVARIWNNPDCPSTGSCTDANVGFFDLISPTAANAQLNSQGLPIKVGQYRYVRVDFCIGSASSDNVKFKVAGGVETTAKYGGCGVTSAKLDPPVEVTEGGTVTIALDYDLSSASNPTDPILYSASGSTTCTTTAPCLGSIRLTPRIVR